MRIEAIIADVIRRRKAGEPWDDEAVLSAHPELRELLTEELSKLRFDAGVTDVSSPTPSFSEVPALFAETTEHGPKSTKDGNDALDSSWAATVRPPTGADRFHKVRIQAVGGMGQVWVAQDAQIRREVALKELKEERKSDKTIATRFLAEGHITGALEHPGIIPVYALGVDSHHQPYYAMRFVRGESLRQAIKSFHAAPASSGKFSRSNPQLRELLRRFSDVCVTMSYAHSRGVLHRDLKPDNIMLGKYGETYVVDWGMARVVGARAENFTLVSEEIVTHESLGADSGTRYGSAMGTPGFMSPEQAAGKIDELSITTDIYSLGSILYFLLTNEVSISADTLREFLQRVKVGDIRPASVVNPQAPKPLCAACEKAMAKSPASRYQSARELAADIDRWLADEPVSAQQESRVEKVARFARWHYRWLAPLLLASLVAAVAALLAAVSIDRAQHRAETSAAAESVAKVRAEQNFLDARTTVDQWLTGFTEALEFYPGVNEFRRRMLEQAAVRYERFLQQAENDATLELESAHTYVRLGDIRRQLLNPSDAAAAYQKAVDVFSKLQDRDAPLEARDGKAQALGRLAVTYEAMGDAERARRITTRPSKRRRPWRRPAATTPRRRIAIMRRRSAIWRSTTRRFSRDAGN